MPHLHELVSLSRVDTAMLLEAIAMRRPWMQMRQLLRVLLESPRGTRRHESLPKRRLMLLVRLLLLVLLVLLVRLVRVCAGWETIEHCGLAVHAKGLVVQDMRLGGLCAQRLRGYVR